MSTNNHLRLLASDEHEEQPGGRDPRLLSDHAQPPHLRLIVCRDEAFEVPRRYGQSTSGRVSSTGTLPPLSRSSEIARRSPILAPTDNALRKYPIDVSQRLAYDSCPDGERLLRYVRSDSTDATLPMGKVKSRPMEHLPFGNGRYADSMEAESAKALFATRRERLRQLIGGRTQVDFVQELTERAAMRPDIAESLTAFMDTTYLSRALKGKKNIGEEPAAALEVLYEKPRGWMSSRSQAKEPWPFEFPRALWDDLGADEKRDVERHLQVYLEGLRARRPQQSSTRRRRA